MKIYKSAKDNATLKAYKYAKMYCVRVEYSDGTVLIGQYPTADGANKLFQGAKKKHPDLHLVK